MKGIKTRNNNRISYSSIPYFEPAEFRKELLTQCGNGFRVISFFGFSVHEKIALCAVTADDENSNLYIMNTVPVDYSYPSLTPEIPAMHLFEREVYEDFGIVPEGHPWLKPVRYSKDRYDKSSLVGNYPFYEVEGDEVHQVGVGPIHAGIIEPGHFRFHCHSENVFNLEIQLGYQHRGVENLITAHHNNAADGKNSSRRFAPHLAESIAGDTVIAHTGAYARMMETMSGMMIADRPSIIRAIALELERAAVHIGDLGAIANDIAFLIGSSMFGATRTLAINALLSICGSRFGRGLIRPGGSAFDIDDALVKQLTKTVEKIIRDVEFICSVMFDNASVLARIEDIGILQLDDAMKIGVVGLAARASGIPLDVRSDHPFGAFKRHPFYKRTMEKGDVFSRTYLRYIEIIDSLQFVLEELSYLPKGGELLQKDLHIIPDSAVVSMMEGWRGEVVHVGLVDETGKFLRYKIKDPSFNNWYGLELAMRGNEISDFPVCNKSFNLSYCGFDL